MAELHPRYQDITQLIGPSHTAFCKTSFGVNCRLLWIFENKSRFSEKELKKELKPYIMWSKKAQNHHWPQQFPFYNKASLKVRNIQKIRLNCMKFIFHEKSMILGLGKYD